MSNGELLIVIFAGVIGIQLAIWIPIIVKLRRMKAQIARDLANERVERGPERANYSGGSPEFGRARTSGKLALTARRLVFYKVFGKPIEIVRADIASVRTEASFHHVRLVGGQAHVVVKIASGAEAGFVVADRAAWLAALGGTPS